MITQTDRNYRSFDGKQEDVTDVKLDPLGAGWKPGSWADTCKFYHRENRTFSDFEIVDGGTEDAVDCSSRNNDNRFIDFIVSAGDRYVLTLKGSSKNNMFYNWLITKPGKWVDVQVGNWSDDDLNHDDGAFSSGNEFSDWARIDGKPIRYAYRWGCKPYWHDTKTTHLWWMSIGITIYWWGKYLYLKATK